MYKITIHSGYDKSNRKENFNEISFCSGQLISIVGNTGSGKSRLIKDIEQLVNLNSASKRKVVLNNTNDISDSLNYGHIAHLGQNMRFILDCTVKEFINLHNSCRNKNCSIAKILAMANSITPEPILEDMILNLLSGGQTRALMIADISLICDSPIVLIDEIENAGIDKIKALNILINSKKLVIIVTHDPHTALMAKKRIIMENGGILKMTKRSKSEELLYIEMSANYNIQLKRQQQLRSGGIIT